MKKFIIFVFTLFNLVLFSDEKESRNFSLNLGFSYVGTSGNTENKTIGLDLELKKNFQPWGIEAKAGYLRSEQDNSLNADRIKTQIKGFRSISQKINYFITLDWEKDRFSGFDRRTGISSGIDYKIYSSEKDIILSQAGVSYFMEEYTTGENDKYFAGLFGLKYTHNWTEKSKFEQKFLYIPNFEESQKWRGEAETSIIASLTEKMALKFSFYLRYLNKPLSGFEKTDTINSISIVISF